MNRLRRGWANQAKKSTQKEVRKNKIGTMIYSIGEASNPGPELYNGKQSKLGDDFHHRRTKKDDKDMWCKEKGFSIGNVAGDGNCLYACLGRSRKISGNR
eukprot:9006025-Heterocapsa_arctica.AAC.1